MKKRVLAAMMACAMAAGLLSGCSSEPKNPGDSNEPVTTAAAGQTEAGGCHGRSPGGVRAEDLPRLYDDRCGYHQSAYLYHERFRRRDRQDFPPALPPVSQRGGDQFRVPPGAGQKKSRNRRMRKERYGISRSVKMPSGKMETPLT